MVSPRPSISPLLVGVDRTHLLHVGQHVQRSLIPRAQADLAIQPRARFRCCDSGCRARPRARCPWPRASLENPGTSTSTPQPGRRSRIARMVSANNSAPPSLRSSRLTLVMTANFSPSAAQASATRRGSSIIHRQRAAFLHRAEAAAARADVAQDHERRGAAVPAIADVGTSRALAHRVQVQIPHQLLQVAVIIANRSGSPQPSGPRRAEIRW